MVGCGGSSSSPTGVTPDGGPTPLSVSAGGNQAVCAGAGVVIGPAVHAGYTYAWSPSTGLSAANVAQPTASPSQTTTYKVTVTDPSTHASGSAQVIVTVNAVPSVSASAAAPTISAGGSTSVTASGSGGTAPYSYAWAASDATCASGSCFSATNISAPTVSPAASSDFTVTLTDANGCRAQGQTHVDVAAALGVSAGASASAICAGDSVSLSATPSGGLPAYSFSWTSDVGCATGSCISDPSSASPSVSPGQDTTFTATVTDSLGATSQSSTSISVLPDPGLAGVDQFIAPGSSVVIGPSSVASATYAWTCDRADCALTLADGGDPTVDSQPMAGPALSTQYTLDDTTGTGCVRNSAATVWVTLGETSFPASGASYPVSNRLQVQFDQPMLSGSEAGNVALTDATTGAALSATTSYDAANNVLTITPTDAAYVSGGSYTLTLTGGAAGVRSDDAVLPNIFANDVAIAFSATAADTTAPTAVSEQPASGATNIALNTLIALTVSEPLDPASVSAASVVVTDQNASGAQVAGTLSYDFVNQTVRFQPSADLAASHLYQVSVSGLADLASPANTLSTSWQFSTGTSLDTFPPTVSAVTPDGSSSVLINTKVVVTFSEPVDSTTTAGAVQLVNTTDGSIVGGTSTFNSTNNTLTFTPSQYLAGATGYQINVSGVRDLAGNQMAADGSHTFTTQRVLFSDGFENGTTQWTLGGKWALSTALSLSPTHSLADNTSTKNTATYATMASALDVSSVTGGQVTLLAGVDTRSNKGTLAIEYSLDGGATWTQASSQTGNGGWKRQQVAITTGSATSLLVRFKVSTGNNTGGYKSSLVDEVYVQAP
jgi:hypothetical protein